MHTHAVSNYNNTDTVVVTNIESYMKLIHYTLHKYHVLY